MNNISKKYLFFSFIMMAIAIAIGAFGAHGLKNTLIQNNTLANYETASNYFRLGSTSVMIIGLILNFETNKLLKLAANLIIVGTVIFAFTLYILSVTNIKWLGAITPVGGFGMIVGHLLIAYHFYKPNKKP